MYSGGGWKTLSSSSYDKLFLEFDLLLCLLYAALRVLNTAFQSTLAHESSNFALSLHDVSLNLSIVEGNYQLG